MQQVYSLLYKVVLYDHDESKWWGEVNVYVINRGHKSANQSMGIRRRGFRMIALKFSHSISWTLFIHMKGYAK